MRILVVEDDARVAAFVAKGVRALGGACDVADDGLQALTLAAEGRYGAMVLDRMLPHLDGLGVLARLRERGDRTPVLILSALGEVEDRIAGLRAGGDDYLVKPFDLEELVARIEALLRRGSEGPGPATRLVHGDLEVDLIAREVRRGGKAVDLTDREFRLLEYLVRHAGATVTRAMILRAVWDYSFDPQTNIIDQHVSRLRQKLDRGFTVSLIHTVRGAGYAMGTTGP